MGGGCLPLALDLAGLGGATLDGTGWLGLGPSWWCECTAGTGGGGDVGVFGL